MKYDKLTTEELTILANGGIAAAADELARRSRPTQMTLGQLLAAGLKEGFKFDDGAFNGCEGTGWAAFLGEGYVVLDVSDHRVVVEVCDMYGTGIVRQYVLRMEEVD